ncbi:MAG: hypothetical protein EBR88_00340 [Betaproteobacteria bacterium]|nr:hypothetical protein [Betaproteobacteria bacterium]
MATNFKDDPNKLKKSLLTGEMVPDSVWWQHRDWALQRSGGENKVPIKAAGRFFTDAPEQLDFYVRENGTSSPAYYVDVPNDSLHSIHVRNTPFAYVSANPDREFLVPDEYLKNSQLLLQGLLGK